MPDFWDAYKCFCNNPTDENFKIASAALDQEEVRTPAAPWYAPEAQAERLAKIAAHWAERKGHA